MRKYHILSIIFLLFSTFIHCQQAQYKIDGKISSANNGKLIMLFRLKEDTIFSVDTTNIKNGTFQFQGDEDLNDLAIITTGNYPEVVSTVDVALERGIINVDMDSLTITGTPLNALYKTYSHIHTLYGVKLDSLYNKDRQQAMVENSELNKLFRESRNYKKKFIIDNLANPVGLRIFFDEISNLYDTDFNEILDALPKQYLADVRIVTEKERRIENKKKYENRTSLVGSKYTDFELITPENTKRKLSDSVGKTKYVFLDFWASWCSPCVADVPYLKKVYDKYKVKGLEIISISLDTSIESWKKTIQRVDAPWIHLSNLKGYSELTKAYGVNMIPMAFLLDENGTIIEVNLRGESLGVVLDQLLK